MLLKRTHWFLQILSFIFQICNIILNALFQDAEFSVRVSYLELYNEEIFDLLSAADDTTRESINSFAFP